MLWGITDKNEKYTTERADLYMKFCCHWYETNIGE
jgi:hypothetical protein